MNPFLTLALVATIFSLAGSGMCFTALRRQDQAQRQIGGELLAIGALLTGMLLFLLAIIDRG